MSDDGEPEAHAPPPSAERRISHLSRSLIAVARGRLSAERGDPFARAGLRLFDRAEKVLDRLDGVAETLQRVAEVELRLVRKLEPIVEDLGELVRLRLDEARARAGLPPRALEEGVTSVTAVTIDLEPDED